MNIKDIPTWLWSNRTKVFGFIQVTIAYFAAAEGVFSPQQLKIYLFANGLLTVWLGFFNSTKIKQADQ
jgi:hypothetical protein